MKNLLYLLLLTMLFACKNDDNPTIPVNELAQTWVLDGSGYVTADGRDITSEYTGFSINFIENDNGNVFFVTNGAPAFPEPADTWFLKDENQTTIVRGSDNKEIDIVLEGSSLTMRFTMQPPSSGRVEGTFGEFEFKLNTFD